MKKAIIKTFLDVIKFIGCALFVVGASIGIIYLLIFTPYWVLSSLELWEKYADTPFGLMLAIEIVIVLGAVLTIWLISALYRANLKKINENEIHQLQNANPTNAEKGLYHNYGYYPVERHPISNGNSDADYTYIRYAICYTEPEQRKSYPNVIEIEEKNISYEDSIIFETLSESIKIGGRVDVDLLEIITERAKELFESEKNR